MIKYFNLIARIVYLNCELTKVYSILLNNLIIYNCKKNIAYAHFHTFYSH